MKQMKYNDYIKLINDIVENEFNHIEEGNLKGMDELDKYKEISKEVDNIQKKLFEVLPDEYKDLVDDWDTKIWEMLCMQIRYYFKKGVAAGTSNLNFIRDITNGYNYF